LLNSRTYVNVTDLVPSTKYRVSVEIRPLRGGYWSDAATHQITTLPDGAFQMVPPICGWRSVIRWWNCCLFLFTFFLECKRTVCIRNG